MMNVRIGGGVSKYKLIMIFMARNKNLIDDMQITYYDMPNDCSWNGGRINRNIVLTDNMLNTFNNNKSGFCLGFTNLVILDMGDKIGNDLLRMVSNNNPHKLHGVVLASETLRRYIRKNYPDLKLTYSITGHPTTDCLNFQDYYKELEEKYDVIVPKFSHLEKILPLLEQKKLDSKKYEILINDNCNASCQFYAEHFTQISHINSSLENAWENYHEKSYQIEIKPMIKPGIQKNIDCINVDDLESNFLQKFYDVGVKHFKISGRDYTDDYFLMRLPVHLKEIKKLV